MSDVLDNLRCELYDAVKENAEQDPWLYGWSSGYTLTLFVDRDAGASTDTSLVIPVNNGFFTFGLRAGLGGQAKQTVEVKGRIPLLGAHSYYHCPQNDPGYRGRLLSGNLGLRQWLRKVVPDLRQGAPNGITYTVEFIVSANGTITPSWALTHRGGRMFKPSISIGGTRINSHKLILALAGPPTVSDESKSLVEIPNGRFARRVVIENLSELASELTKIDRERAEMKVDELKNKLGQKTFSEDPKAAAELEAELKAAEKELADANNKARIASQRANVEARRIKTYLPSKGPALEADIERRIDDAITRQVIRDAFR